MDFVFKELGTIKDIVRFSETREYKINCARNKLLCGKEVYTCSSHKGFYVYTSNPRFGVGLGYIYYSASGETSNRMIFGTSVIDICKSKDTFMKYNNIHVDMESSRKAIIVTDDNKICCIVGIEHSLRLGKDDLYDIEQDDNYIICHIANGGSILISKSDYSSAWTDKDVSLSNLIKR